MKPVESSLKTGLIQVLQKKKKKNSPGFTSGTHDIIVK